MRIYIPITRVLIPTSIDFNPESATYYSHSCEEVGEDFVIPPNQGLVDPWETLCMLDIEDLRAGTMHFREDKLIEIEGITDDIKKDFLKEFEEKLPGMFSRDTYTTKEFKSIAESIRDTLLEKKAAKNYTNNKALLFTENSQIKEENEQPKPDQSASLPQYLLNLKL